MFFCNSMGKKNRKKKSKYWFQDDLDRSCFHYMVNVNKLLPKTCLRMLFVKTFTFGFSDIFHDAVSKHRSESSIAVKQGMQLTCMLSIWINILLFNKHHMCNVYCAIYRHDVRLVTPRPSVCWWNCLFTHHIATPTQSFEFCDRILMISWFNSEENDYYCQNYCLVFHNSC